MKKITAILLIVLGVLISSTAVGAASLSPGLDILAAENGMTVSAKIGETITFDEDMFAASLSNASFEGIEIKSLPSKDAGTLYFGDVSVTSGQVIRKSDISNLRFVPSESVTAASFGFSFDDSYVMTCSLRFTEKENTSPVALSAVELCAFTGESVYGEMRAHDAEGDSLFFEVVSYPEGGELLYDSKTGEFSYTAGSRVTNDSFTFRVKDSAGNYSKVCEYTLSVTKNDSDTVFCDMEKANCASAVTMANEGYMTFIEDNGKMYFSPDEEMSRLDFLVTAMDVFGAGNIPATTSTGFSDDASIPEKYKGYVYSAAKLDIISESGSFRPYDTITRGEASVILNNIIGYEAKTVNELSGVPVWAQDAVSAMYELGVYDLENGDAAASSSLTKGAAADMLYRVYCLLGE